MAAWILLLPGLVFVAVGVALLLPAGRRLRRALPPRVRPAWILAAGAVLTGAAGAALPVPTPRDEPVTAAAIVREIRDKQQFPKKISDHVVIDSVHAVDDRVLMDFRLDIADPAEFEATVRKLAAELRPTVCGDKNDRRALQSGVVFIFRYYRQQESDFTKVEIGGEDCAAPAS
jgi:hypothetical protein